MTGPTYFFENGKRVRVGKSGIMVVPAVPRPAETVKAAVAAVKAEEEPGSGIAAAPPVPTPAPPDAWEASLAALRAEQAELNRAWGRKHAEHEERIKAIQQQITTQVEEVVRRMLE